MGAELMGSGEGVARECNEWRRAPEDSYKALLSVVLTAFATVSKAVVLTSAVAAAASGAASVLLGTYDLIDDGI